MHPRLEALFTTIDAQRSALAEAVALVPEALRERRIVADRWSVAEVLEHLSLVEMRVARTIGATIAAAGHGAVGVEEDASPVPVPKRLQAVIDRQQRVKSPDKLVPTAALSCAEAWAALERSRQALRAAAVAADGLALATLSAPHPFLGPLNLYQWFAFVGAHETRHAAQIREIAGELTIHG